MKRNIGIDFGTSNSAIGYHINNIPELIRNKDGDLLTPSVISFNKKDGWIVGLTAKENWIINPFNTVYSIKRILGKKIEDILLTYSYQIKEDSSGELKIVLDENEFFPEEIAAQILQHLFSIIDLDIKDINNVVVSIPARFNHLERNSLIDALQIVGVEKPVLINEPTAAAIFYGYLYPNTNENLLVFDMGGGTLDISCVEISNNEYNVLGTYGENNLGGDDLDEEIVDYIADDFMDKHGIDLRLHPSSYVRLKMEAEKAKVSLTSYDLYNFVLPYICTKGNENLHIRTTISKKKFNELVRPYIERIIKISQNAIKLIGISKSSIDKVLLVGGATNIPIVQETVREYFNKPIEILRSPETLVALGACVFSEKYVNKQTKEKKSFVVDVLPFSIGIETAGGGFDVILEENQSLPATVKKIYSTAADNQPSVEIHVLQGEDILAKHNKSIGKFILDGIPPAPRGVPQIEVSFSVDNNGIFSISATDLGTGNSQSLTIDTP